MSWQIDPSSGDYIMTNGAPVDDPDLIFPAYYRLKIKRKSWLYAPNDKFGSDFFKVVRNVTTKPQTALEKIAARAVQPIVDDGRATNINVTVTQQTRSGVVLETDITNAQNQVTTLELNGLGVV